MDVLGFHDCIMDCVDADLVMVRAGTSVAIDRVTALLRVAGCSARMVRKRVSPEFAMRLNGPWQTL